MPLPDDDDLPQIVAPDDLSALCQFLTDKLSPDDLSNAYILIERLVDSFGTPDDIAEDQALKGYQMIDRNTIREIQAIKVAEAEVAPYVGAVLGCDSAYAVYAEALRRQGRSAKGLANSAAAAREIFRALSHSPRRVGMDSAGVSRRNEMFPNGGRLGNA